MLSVLRTRKVDNLVVWWLGGLSVALSVLKTSKV